MGEQTRTGLVLAWPVQIECQWRMIWVSSSYTVRWVEMWMWMAWLCGLFWLVWNGALQAVDKIVRLVVDWRIGKVLARYDRIGWWLTDGWIIDAGLIDLVGWRLDWSYVGERLAYCSLIDRWAVDYWIGHGLVDWSGAGIVLADWPGIGLGLADW